MNHRYVIVCLIKGTVSEYHEKLVNDICKNFEVKRQRLPSHFTIKAPFETENIEEIEKLTEYFCKNKNQASVKIEGFGHFRENVVYMDVLPSDEAVNIHDEYIDKLRTVNWLDWKRNEGKGRIFHCTLVSRIPEGKFNAIWNYVSKNQCNFHINFDNISILIWEKDKWVTYKEYTLK